MCGGRRSDQVWGTRFADADVVAKEELGALREIQTDCHIVGVGEAVASLLLVGDLVA